MVLIYSIKILLIKRWTTHLYPISQINTSHRAAGENKIMILIKSVSDETDLFATVDTCRPLQRVAFELLWSIPLRSFRVAVRLSWRVTRVTFGLRLSSIMQVRGRRLSHIETWTNRFPLLFLAWWAKKGLRESQRFRLNVLLPRTSSIHLEPTPSPTESYRAWVGVHVEMISSQCRALLHWMRRLDTM